MKNKKKLIIGLLILAIIAVTIVTAIIASPSLAAPLENDVRIEENSELIYYIDVIYDGKDVEATTSSDNATARVYSDYIYVEDKIPDGLIFKGFVSSADGDTIGAVKRSDGTYCAGYVENGMSGLEYNELTHTVSFKVKNLQAGCKITVGIITQTPTLPTGIYRMDFYNTAYGREGSSTVNSNTVHTFIGRNSASTYQVIYQYEGDVPEGAPNPPVTTSYVAGSTVGVSQDITVEGYDFSGWTTDDVAVSNGSFTMPTNTVTFVGSFTEKKDNYNVSYTISGDVPEGYAVPLEKSYAAGSDVKLDSLKPGDVINGYRFLGWTSTDVELPDTSTDESTIFTMPNHDVEIVGSFEKISYTVTYLFQGSTIPPNADSLLPTVESYYPGDKVTLAPYPEASGYRFLGWYYADEFTMPEENVVIYGEWTVETGTFAPTITKSISNKQDSYKEGDIVTFDITVTNTADFAIRDVILEEGTDGCYFVTGNDYTVRNDSYVLIQTIAPGNSVTVHAQYEAGSDVVRNITNVVELTGALADNNYYLDTSQDYIAASEFVVANISLEITKINEDNETLTGAEFTLYRNQELTNIVSTGLSFNGLTPNTTYYLAETKVPTGYQILGKVLEINVGSDGTITIPEYDVSTQNGVNEVSIINSAINVLPNTGGSGVIPYIVIGLILVIAGVVCLIVVIRKRGEKHEKSNM